jgi:prevent-host-death family protein
MDQIYSVTEAKIKLSEIISRVHFRMENFTITKKGKAVAVIAPCDEVSGEEITYPHSIISIAEDLRDFALCLGAYVAICTGLSGLDFNRPYPQSGIRNLLSSQPHPPCQPFN